MNIDYPLPNVVCRCGTLLFSWADVLEHWENHRLAAFYTKELERPPMGPA